MIKKGTKVTVTAYSQFYGISGVVTTIRHTDSQRYTYVKVDGHVNPTGKNYDIIVPLCYLRRYDSAAAKRARISTSWIRDDEKFRLYDKLNNDNNFNVDSELPKRYPDIKGELQ